MPWCLFQPWNCGIGAKVDLFWEAKLIPNPLEDAFRIVATTELLYNLLNFINLKMLFILYGFFMLWMEAFGVRFCKQTTDCASLLTHSVYFASFYLNVTFSFKSCVNWFFSGEFLQIYSPSYHKTLKYTFELCPLAPTLGKASS